MEVNSRQWYFPQVKSSIWTSEELSDVVSMSDQGQNRVLQIQEPTVYFRELGRWFNEGFWQQSRGWNGYNLTFGRTCRGVRSGASGPQRHSPVKVTSLLVSIIVDRTVPGSVRQGSIGPIRFRIGTCRLRRLRWKKESLRWLSAVSRSGVEVLYLW